jgi:hypothetical protein
VIFIEERIRHVDRLIGEAIGKGRYKEGVFAISEVVFSRELRTRDGELVHVVSARLGSRDFQALTPEQAAASVIATIEVQTGKLAEALDALKPRTKHQHVIARIDSKPGTGLVNHHCSCGATRVADFRGVQGEVSLPELSPWKGGLAS